MNPEETFFSERCERAFRGELEVGLPEECELRLEDGNRLKVDENFHVDLHKVKGISPMAIGLLPYDLPVRMKEISLTHGSLPPQSDHVRCIRDLVFLIRHVGWHRISSFFLETRGERIGSFAYLEKELLIVNRDKELVRGFLRRVSALA